MHFTEFNTLSDFIKFCVNEQLKKLHSVLLPELKKVLDKYRTFFTELGYEFYDQIIDAYLLKKPLTGIEFYDEAVNIYPFIISISEFFFVGVYYGKKKNYLAEVFVSRFKNVLDVALQYRLDGKIADLEGLLYGYSPKEIYDYCVREQLTHLIKRRGLLKFF